MSDSVQSGFAQKSRKDATGLPRGVSRLPLEKGPNSSTRLLARPCTEITVKIGCLPYV